MLRADYFKYEVVEKTRFSEDVKENEKSGTINEPVLVVFVCFERVDEQNPLRVMKRSVEAIVDIAKRVGTKNVVLHSFAHLSDSLASPDIAKEIITKIYQKLLSEDYKTPFGWRDTFELRVKSHPISKVSRRILP